MLSILFILTVFCFERIFFFSCISSSLRHLRKLEMQALGSFLKDPWTSDVRSLRKLCQLSNDAQMGCIHRLTSGSKALSDSTFDKFLTQTHFPHSVKGKS